MSTRTGLVFLIAWDVAPEIRNVRFRNVVTSFGIIKFVFVMNAAISRAATWSDLTHAIKSITTRMSSKISPLSGSKRLPLLSSVKMRSGSAQSAEQSCAATTASVTIAALIAYKRGRNCTGGTTNNEVDSSASWPMKKIKEKRVLFLCMHNAARSSFNNRRQGQNRGLLKPF
jgi:hypothetical protein